jgi:hypothetical protein
LFCGSVPVHGRSDARRGLLLAGMFSGGGDAASSSSSSTSKAKKAPVAPVRQVELERAREEAIAAYRSAHLAYVAVCTDYRQFIF